MITTAKPTTPTTPTTATPTTTDLTEVLDVLRRDREAIAWPKRRDLVASVIGPLMQGLIEEPFRSLLLSLVEDPKWEVRREVAMVLGSIPDVELSLLAERLLDDNHAYVRRAAKQSIEKRQKRMRDGQKRKRGLEVVLALEEEIVDQHGQAVANKARRMAEHLYDVLVGTAVHEMRSVLTSLKENNARILEQQQQGTLKGEYLLAKGRVMADRMLFLERLLADMQEFTRPVSEKWEMVRVADLVTETRSLVSENLRARGINTRRVVLDIAVPNTLEVHVARYPIVSALSNVLKNAYEALPMPSPKMPEGWVQISARRRERKVQILIEDTGEGVPEPILAEIRRCLPGRTTKKGYGTGFGLCCARRNLEAHGGRLEIDPRKEECGTCVTLTLPAPVEGSL